MEQRYSASGEVNRYAVRLGGALQFRSGSRSVTLINLSAEGCCLLIGRAKIAVGDEIVVRTLGEQTLHGSVKWIKGMRAGLHFTKPLEQSTLQRLARFDGRSGAVTLLGARFADRLAFAQMG